MNLLHILPKRIPSGLKLCRLILPCLSLLAALAGCLKAPQPGRMPNLVSMVIDGDTLELSSGARIRLLGIDTPETRHRSSSVQELGERAKAHLSKLALGKEVTIEQEPRQRDPYGRVLAYVYLEDGRLLNLSMVEDGYALPYTKYPSAKTQDLLLAAKEAREHKRGLWGSPMFMQESLQSRIRLSRGGICHSPGNKGYERLTNFREFTTLEECLNHGGRRIKSVRK